ncbi:MAG: acetate--CoA ligase family protein [Candidatus Marsarchaeota archaeon]|nr:acetate--CoA ligase family protein [Candidatus Marsarchaeota archaeon]MCL5413491.1 acetate--CoA ligase family protein [Candidatus Marsarchaeota archaeon]
MPLLDYFEGKKLLDRHGIKSVASRYVDSAESAVEFSEGDPIVLKLISGKALHKSKSGLVKLDLRGTEIKRAFAELQEKGKPLKPYRIIAQKMSKGGVEVIMGGRTDPQFGKLILLGLGGIYVEVFKDFALRACPITKQDAEEMIAQLKSRDVITFNGKNSGMVIQLLLSVSKMLMDNCRIDEIDLNPLILRENGYEAVDIRILTK